MSLRLFDDARGLFKVMGIFVMRSQCGLGLWRGRGIGSCAPCCRTETSGELAASAVIQLGESHRMCNDQMEKLWRENRKCSDALGEDTDYFLFGVYPVRRGRGGRVGCQDGSAGIIRHLISRGVQRAEILFHSSGEQQTSSGPARRLSYSARHHSSIPLYLRTAAYNLKVLHA